MVLEGKYQKRAVKANPTCAPGRNFHLTGCRFNIPTPPFDDSIDVNVQRSAGLSSRVAPGAQAVFTFLVEKRVGCVDIVKQR